MDYDTYDLLEFSMLISEYTKQEQIFKRYGYTRLMYICEKGYDKLLKYLLDMKHEYVKDINSQCDNFHMTALMFAIENNNEECVTLLLKHKYTNLNLIDINNHDVYEYAKNCTNKKIKKMFHI